MHAIDIAKKSLDFYENDYFNISDAVPPKIGKNIIHEFMKFFNDMYDFFSLRLDCCTRLSNRCNGELGFDWF